MIPSTGSRPSPQSHPPTVANSWRGRHHDPVDAEIKDDFSELEARGLKSFHLMKLKRWSKKIILFSQRYSVY
jgi:hypothetical protein